METSLLPIYEPTALELRADMEISLDILALESDAIIAIDIVDTKTRTKIHDQQMILRNKRILIENACESFNEAKKKEVKDAVNIKNDLIKRIKSKEDILKEKKEQYDSEQERIKQEQEAKKQAKITARIQSLAQFNITYDTINHGTMSEEDFETLIFTKKTEFEEAEKSRLEKEAADRKEREEFARQKAELDAQKKEQDEQARKIREDQERLDSEKRAIERNKELEQARKEAEEKSRIDTEARMKREQAEADQKRQAEADAIALAEKEEQKKLEKKRKYQAWLTENGVTEDGTWKIEKTSDSTKVVIWKKVSEFII